MSWLDSVASPQGKPVSRRGRRSSDSSIQSAHDRSSMGETSELSKDHIRAARKRAVERTRKRAADMHAQAQHHENLARDKKNEMRNRAKVAIRATRAQEINAMVLRYRSEQIQQERSEKFERLMKFCSGSPLLMDAMAPNSAQQRDASNAPRIYADLVEHVLVVGLSHDAVHIASQNKFVSTTVVGRTTATQTYSATPGRSGSKAAPSQEQTSPPQQTRQQRGSDPCSVTFEPEILYNYPEDKKVEFGCIADFCMPSGVKVQAYPDREVPNPLPALSLAPSSLKKIRQRWKATTVTDAHNGQDWHSFVRKYDANRNGTIELDEFKLLLRKGLRVSRGVLSDAQMTTLFRELDTSSSRSLSLDQIQSLFEYDEGGVDRRSAAYPPKRRDDAVSAPHREYIFRLTGGGAEGADVYYGICLQTTVAHRCAHLDGVLDSRAEMQRCVCIITRHPFLGFFFGVLRDLAHACDGDIERSTFDDIVNCYVQWPVPAPGTTQIFEPARGAHAFEVVRPPLPPPYEGSELHGVPEEIVLLREWALPILFSSMTLDNVMMVLGCAMREMHVLVVTDDLQLLAGTIWSVVCLLHPLKWANPLIVTVPNTLYEFLDSPIPPLLGVEQLPGSFVAKPGVVIVRPDKNLVKLHDEDMQHYHTLCVPQMSRLCHELEGYQSILRGPGGLVPPVMQNLHLDLKRSSSPAWGPTPPSVVHQAAFKAIVDAIFLHQVRLLDAALELDAEQIRVKLQDCPALQIEGLAWHRADANNANSGGGYGDSDANTTSGRSIDASEESKGSSWRELLGDAGREFMTRVLESQMVEVYSYESAAKKHGALHRGRILDETRKLVRNMDPSRPEPGDLPPVTAGLVREGIFFDLFHLLVSRGELSNAHHRAIAGDKEHGRSKSKVLWCNGMCGGLMNTPLCTSLCLQHWQNRYTERMEMELFKKAATAGIMNFNETAGTKIHKQICHPAETPSQWRRARWRRRTETTVPKSKLQVKNAKRRVVMKRINQIREKREANVHQSALEIQSATRTLLQRRAQDKEYQAAVLIQASWREAKLRARWRVLRPLRLHIAARKIQYATRTFIAKPAERLSYMDLVAKIEKSAARHASSQKAQSTGDILRRTAASSAGKGMVSLTDVALRSMATPQRSSPSPERQRSSRSRSAVQDRNRDSASSFDGEQSMDDAVEGRRGSIYLDSTADGSTLDGTQTGGGDDFYDAMNEADEAATATSLAMANLDPAGAERDEARLAAFKLLLLTTGVVVVKHGRIGGMKRRMLTCDDTFTVLMWNEEEPPTRQGPWKYVRQRMQGQDNYRSIPFEDITGASIRNDLRVAPRGSRRPSKALSTRSRSSSRSSLFSFRGASDVDAGFRRRSWAAVPSNSATESIAQGSTYATEHGSDVSSDAGMSRRRRSSLFKRAKFAPEPDELGYCFTINTRSRNLELEIGDELLMKRLVDGFNLLAQEVRSLERGRGQSP